MTAGLHAHIRRGFVPSRQDGAPCQLLHGCARRCTSAHAAVVHQHTSLRICPCIRKGVVSIEARRRSVSVATWVRVQMYFGARNVDQHRTGLSACSRASPSVVMRRATQALWSAERTAISLTCQGRSGRRGGKGEAPDHVTRAVIAMLVWAAGTALFLVLLDVLWHVPRQRQLLKLPDLQEAVVERVYAAFEMQGWGPASMSQAR